MRTPLSFPGFLIYLFFLCFPALLLAQSIEVKGIVVDEGNGEPISNLSISVVGMDKTYQTEEDGTFYLLIPRRDELVLNFFR